MVKKVESGAPPPSPPIDTTTGPESVQGEAGTQPQAATNPELPNTAAAMPYDTGGQISEYNLDGQMRAALLKSLIPGSGGPTPGTLPPPGTLYWGPPGGAGTETAPPAPTELKEGSKGTAVEEAENHINWWRAENGRKPIKVDGNFDAETKAAVSDFQKANGMKVTGKIDQKTTDRLELENNPSFKKLDDTTK
jgi:peptidoglycan hydrolase-like protein with peptidoglycan-binding domain